MDNLDTDGSKTPQTQPSEAKDHMLAKEHHQISKILTAIARKAVENALINRSGPNKGQAIGQQKIDAPFSENDSFVGESISDPTLELLHGPAACFVSLKKRGDLRGCIGTIYPAEKDLATEVERNALSAAFQDPRFPGVGLDELNEIIFSVDVLTEPHPISDRNMLDPKKYGVIVRSGSRQGLLLPDLEGVETVDQQIRIAASKGGIAPDEKFDLLRFEVLRFKEPGDQG